MADLFSRFAQSPSPRSNGGAALPKEFLGFLAALAAASLRISYSGAERVVCAIRGVTRAPNYSWGRNARKAIVAKLPPELQPFVCTQGGEYHDKAYASWRAQGIEVPQGLEDMDVLTPGMELKAFEAYLAAQQEAATEDDAE